MEPLCFTLLQIRMATRCVVEQLLKAEADVNKAIRTDFGATPLYMAAQNGHEGVVEQLLKAEADVDKAATRLQTMEPLHFTLLQKKATRAWLSSS